MRLSTLTTRTGCRALHEFRRARSVGCCRPSHGAAAASRSSIHTLQAPAGQPQRHSTVSVTAVAGASATAGGSMSYSTAAAAAKAGPQEVPSGMDTEAMLMEQLTSIPLISKATCRPSHNTGGRGVDIQVLATQHNLPSNSKRQLQFTAFVPEPHRHHQVLCSGLPIELQQSVLNSPSPSGRRSLIAKSSSDGVLLELWAHNRIVKELLVPKSLHGPIINDGWFSRGAAWNPTESIIVYVAEESAAEQTPKFGSSSSNGSGSGSNGSSSNGEAAAAPRTWRGVSAAVEDWGELNTGKRTPSLFALNTDTWQVHKLAGLADSDASWGQPVWTPDGSGIVAVAWPHKAANFPHTSRRLGIVHCFNRPCGLHYIPYPAPPAAAGDDGQPAADGAAAAADVATVPLTASLLSGLSPVFTPDGSQLLFISQEAAAASGVHAATSALYSLAWNGQPSPSQKPHCIIHAVHKPEAPGAFPGLYAFSLHEQGFAGPQTLLVTSQWYSQTVILAVGLKDGSVTPVTPTDARQGSWTLQGVCNGLAVATVSAPHHPPRLMLAPVPASLTDSSSSSSSSSSWDWSPVQALEPDLSLLPEAAAALSDMQCEVLDVVPTVGDTDLHFQAVVQVSKSRAGPAPTVLVPHGGPHSAVAANFYMPFVLLAARGYSIVAVNFRGSLGFGEAGVQALPGHIGHYDVEDCIAALDAAVAGGFADKDRAAVIGGSHGGFLTGHLMGQHPERFRCAGLRNPVLNIALMVGVTDIPDWCYVEAYGTQEGRKRFSAEPSAEDLAKFWAVSPIAHIGGVKGPMMFMLGAKDRRVPLDDGWRYLEALRSRGVETRVLVFPEDSHALDKPQTEFEQWLNLAWWLKQHMG
uniref:acylaminoacyl-peptidase n=1 Tax=Tetradesmus obliquus TaxID=3088 RepID=A0A383VD43_TETOB|eukprot:jgi/Sobl393_1/2127/SZX62850.1